LGDFEQRLEKEIFWATVRPTMKIGKFVLLKKNRSFFTCVLPLLLTIGRQAGSMLLPNQEKTFEFVPHFYISENVNL
jgi:hypothetical protein